MDHAARRVDAQPLRLVVRQPLSNPRDVVEVGTMTLPLDAIQTLAQVGDAKASLAGALQLRRAEVDARQRGAERAACLGRDPPLARDLPVQPGEDGEGLAS